eukprot:5713362-Pleurochrysis_carterae.AAC.1
MTEILRINSQNYDSSQMTRLLGVGALREQRALSHPSRGYSQLSSLGKLRRREHKIKSEVPEASASVLPEDHPFTCDVSVFESILRGESPPFVLLGGSVPVLGEGGLIGRARWRGVECFSRMLRQH